MEQSLNIVIKHNNRNVSFNIPLTEKDVRVVILDQQIEVSLSQQSNLKDDVAEKTTRQKIIERLKKDPILKSMYAAFNPKDTTTKRNRQLIAVGAFIESVLTEEELNIYIGRREEDDAEETDEETQEQEQEQGSEEEEEDKGVEDQEPEEEEQEEEELEVVKPPPPAQKKASKKNSFDSLFDITM